MRSDKEALYLDEIREASRQPGSAFRVVVLRSDHDEHADANTLTAALDRPLPSYDHHLCGPAEMVASVRKDLRLNGVPSDNVHFERFKLR